MQKRQVLLMAMLLMAIIWIIISSDSSQHGFKKYDCSISEISPDYPVEVKEACRRIRAGKHKE